MVQSKPPSPERAASAACMAYHMLQTSSRCLPSWASCRHAISFVKNIGHGTLLTLKSPYVEVSVRDVQLYIHAFIQRPRLHWKKAFEVDTLKSVTIMSSLCTDVELLPLLRLKALHLSIVINVDSAEPDLDEHVEPLLQIFNNENDLWLRWVKTGAMTQA
jgi:hypothetical protein